MAALAAGMAAAGAGAEPPPAELVALVAAAVAALLAAVGSPALGAAGAVLLVVGATVGQARVQAIEAPGDAIAGGASVQAKATILGPPRPSAFGSSAELEIDTGPAAGARLVARASDDLEWPPAAPPGSEVRVRGYAQPAEEDPGADFDWPGYLRRRGIAGELELEAVRATGGRRGGLLGAVDSARGRAERALAERATHSQAALIRGMVLGQDQAIDPLLRDDFRAAGLAHILAVSGQNVVLLALLATPVLAALGLGPRGRVLAVLALIALYVPLAGAGPSLQRAGIMGAAGLVALALGRPASRWYGLLVASAATLALNPRGCGEAGWQLSFAAVAGILAIAPLIRPALGWLPRPLSEGVALTVSATVATAPLLAHHFDQVSIASLPANLVALPAVAPAMWIGMVQVALGQLFSAGDPLAGLATTLATWLGAVNGVLLDYLAALARRAAETPWAEAAVDFDSPSEVAAAYLAIAAVAMAIARISRRLGPATAAFAGLSAAWWRTRSRAARAAAAIVLAALALALAGVGGGSGERPEELTVSFLDVGQGDATLVSHPDGGTVLIDGGPAEARVYRQLEEIGVERLDLVVATHASADHHGGLREVLQRMPVELLLDGGDGTTDPEFKELLEEADRRGVRRLPARAGQTLSVGGLTVEVLSPKARPAGPPPEDPNQRAVTAIVSAGEFELLASGDAESPSLMPLDLPDVDLLKVPHHGSSDEGLDELLTRIRPEVAAIEVGAANGYGHPAPSTLEALDHAGAEVYRTDLDGTVTVTVAGDEMRVGTER